MNQQIRAGRVWRAEGEEGQDEANAAASDGRTVFLASDDGLDRYQTRIAQDWLEDGRIANFDANPVFAYIHDYEKLPVGRIVGREVKPVGQGITGLFITVEWDLEDEHAARVAGKYARGMMSAVSVGFQPGAWTPLRELDKGHPWYTESPGAMLTRNELYEVSAVVIPGNPRALAQRAAMGWLESGLIASAPEAMRAEGARPIREDQALARLIAEAEGDLPAAHVERIAAEVKAAAPHPFAWLVSK